jgi:hypothetical protein
METDMVFSLLAAAEKVKAAVEETERYVFMTQAELDRLHTYQFTTPTGPKPGFQYKREFWRLPGEEDLWCGPNEGHVRVAINDQKRKTEELFVAAYDGPLESTWFVFTCESDPRDRMYVIHRPKEVKVIQ